MITTAKIPAITQQPAAKPAQKGSGPDAGAAAIEGTALGLRLGTVMGHRAPPGLAGRPPAAAAPPGAARPWHPWPRAVDSVLGSFAQRRRGARSVIAGQAAVRYSVFTAAT